MTAPVLRAVEDGDIAIFYEHQLDPEAHAMLAYAGEPPAERDAYLAKWVRNRADASNVHRTVVSPEGGAVAGYVTCFYRFGEREVGYWLGNAYWGKGLATRAVRELVAIVTTRPLVARVAKHNIGSRRVGEKCGFVVQGEDKYTPVPGGPEVHEWILRLP